MRTSLLLTVCLLGSAWAGGAGPRPLMPDFVTLPPGRSDCETKYEPGCRLRVPLPSAGPLAEGEWRAVPGPDRLSLIYHAPKGQGTKEVSVCCGLQLPLSPVPGTELWGVTAWVGDVQKAVLDLGVAPAGTVPAQLMTWRGPQAPPALARTTTFRGLLHSFKLDSESGLTGKRQISVYTPPGWTEAESLPAVYLADNAAESMAQTLEPLILTGQAPRAVLVGLENGGYLGEPEPGQYTPRRDRRAMEYLEGFPDGEAYFGAHEQFFLKGVIPEVERRFHVGTAPERRVVAGFSNGASWAISMAARHPERFGGVIALSPGWGQHLAVPGPRARVFTSGGTLEPAFLSTAETYAALTEAAGRPTRQVKRVGGHDQIIWQEVFPEAASFVLNAGSKP